MTLVRETIQSPTGGRPRLEAVTWTLIGERSQPITGHLRGDPDRTVAPSVQVVLPVGLDVPVTYTVGLPAGALIEPAGTRWQRTGAGLAPLVVNVPDVTGTVDALDHQSDPPGALLPPGTESALSVERVARVAGDDARPTLAVADARYLAINDPAVTNARTPTAHAGTHATGGTDALALTGEQVTSGTVADARIAATIVRTGDARMSNERAPLDLSVTAAKVAAANIDGLAATPSMRTLGAGPQQAAPGNLIAGATAWTFVPAVVGWSPNPLSPGETLDSRGLNKLCGHVFYSGPAGVTLSLLDHYIGTAGTAGAVVRMGLWTVTNQAQPFKFTAGVKWADLIADLGTVATDSIGRKIKTPGSVVVIPANIWFAVGGVEQVATSIGRCSSIIGRGGSPWPSTNTAAAYYSWMVTALYQDGVSGALGDFVPAGPFYYDSGVGIFRSA